MGLDFVIEWPGWATLDDGMKALENFDAEPLMRRWCSHLIEGNRRGVLAGVDGNDQPMPPLKYRDGKGKRPRKRQVPDYGTTVNEALAGSGANLTTREYQQLTGPRLAPRREESRVIANLEPEVRHGPEPGTWEAVAAWGDVVSKAGVQFLPFHFRGEGNFPQYDLRPVRQQELQFCENELRAFVNQLFRERF